MLAATHITTPVTPVDRLKLVASDHGLVAVLWQRDRPNRVPLADVIEDDTHPILEQT